MAHLIPDADLKITVPDRGRGGQTVGTSNGVQIEHLPSGIVAFVNLDRSQHRNKAIAMDMIEAAVTSPHYRV